MLAKLLRIVKIWSAKLIFLGVLFTSVWIYCFGTAENKYSFNWQEAPFDTWTKYVCQDFLWASCYCISYYMSYSKFSTELRSVIQKRESMKTIFFLAIYWVFFYSASQYAVVPKKRDCSQPELQLPIIPLWLKKLFS